MVVYAFSGLLVVAGGGVVVYLFRLRLWRATEFIDTIGLFIAGQH